MNIEKCPCCSNHCLKDNLSCINGKEYFYKNNSNEVKSINEQVIIDLRKCGHLLHHNKKLDTNQLLLNFSDEELNELHKLLARFYTDI